MRLLFSKERCNCDTLASKLTLAWKKCRDFTLDLAAVKWAELFLLFFVLAVFPHHKPASTRGWRHIPRQRISLKPSWFFRDILRHENFDFTDKREETSHSKNLLCFSTVRLRLCLTRPTERFWHTESFCLLRWERRKKSALCAHITSSPNNLLCARRRSHEKSTLFVSARLCRWDSFFFGLRFWAIFPLFLLLDRFFVLFGFSLHHQLTMTDRNRAFSTYIIELQWSDDGSNLWQKEAHSFFRDVINSMREIRFRPSHTFFSLWWLKCLCITKI